LRFTNDEILNDTEKVLQQIIEFKKNSPLLVGEGLGVRSYTEKKFTPEDLFDYIYAVLHSPSYREKYNEFLKIDFPRVPITEDKEIFWKLVEKGSELRKWHLMEHSDIDKERNSIKYL
jgi:predicted helicase